MAEDSIDSPKSGNSRKKSRQAEEGEHDIVITVIIAKACSEDPLVAGCDHGSLSKIYEAPKAQSYFHCSYKLLGTEKDPVKTDVVTFGAAAKLYTENDTRVLRTWTEEEKTWVAWKNSHNLHVTKALLLKMFNHTLVLKMWDTKDKVSAKARFDRPKAFRLPPLKAGQNEADIETIHSMISIADSLLSKSSSSASVLSGSLKDNSLDKGRTKSNTVVNELNNECRRKMTGIFDYDEQNIIVKIPVNEKLQTPFQNLKHLAADGIKSSQAKEISIMKEETKLLENDHEGTQSRLLSKSSSRRIGKLQEKSNQTSERPSTRQKSNSKSLHIKQNGVANISIPLSSLFTGEQTTTAKLKQSNGSIVDVIITLVLSAPLLSDIQRKILNPMIIKVKSVGNIPNENMSFQSIQKRCVSPYLEYNIFNLPIHKATGSECNKKIYFNDSYVILAGIINTEIINECLNRPPINIALHDRDKNLTIRKQKAKMFGKLETDARISDVNCLTNYPVSQSVLNAASQTIWYPHGIAKLDLSELLLGEKKLELILPVHQCPLPDALTRHKMDINLANGFDDSEIPMPNYIDAQTEMRISVILAHPLIPRKLTITKELAPSVAEECPFTRMVVIFDYNKKDLHRFIAQQIINLNSIALELNDLPNDIINAALSTFKLTVEQRDDKNLDVITGFQIIDDTRHVIVVEGRASSAVKDLWDAINNQTTTDSNDVKILYDSSIHFEKRLYSQLNVEFTRIRLRSPLDELIKMPIIHVRDMIDKSCYDAIIRLHEMTQCNAMATVMRNNLFPTFEMITSLGLQLGEPLNENEFKSHPLTQTPIKDTVTHFPLPSNEQIQDQLINRRPWTPLSTANKEFEATLKSRGSARKDFVQTNRDSIFNRSLSSKQIQPVINCNIDELKRQQVHNYSIQSLNSTEQVKEKLKQELSKDRNARYTYCQDYLSATVPPIKSNVNQTQNTKKRTNDFVYPGVKSSIESNQHASRPHHTRIEELDEPWRENILHANILKPTVDRPEFRWKYRTVDFERHSKPTIDDCPVTIHLAGDSLAKEQLEAKSKDKTQWQKNVVVDSTKFYVHRCAPKTELCERGAKSASQITRQKDILKDKPHKYSLSAPGFLLRRIPTLTSSSPHVSPLKTDQSFTYSTYLQNENISGFHPGPFHEKSWLLESNRIPVRGERT